jgi:hypothetical protein
MPQLLYSWEKSPTVSTKREAALLPEPFYIFEKRKMSCFDHTSNPLCASLWPGQCSLLMKYGLYRTIQLPWGPILKHTQLQHKNIHFIFQCIFVYMCNRMILQIYYKYTTNILTHSWFQTFAMFWMLYAFFRVVPQRLNFICRRFGTESFHTYQPMKMEQTECSETSAYKIQPPGNYPEESINKYTDIWQKILRTHLNTLNH